MDGAKVLLGAGLAYFAYVIFKLGKEAAFEEVREAFGTEVEESFEDAQRANAGLQ